MNWKSYPKWKNQGKIPYTLEIKNQADIGTIAIKQLSIKEVLSE